MYIIFPIFIDSKMMINGLILIFSVCDFWVVKNISGWKLLGLRYWVETDEQGNDQWYFECKLE